MDNIESEVYMSPSNYLIARNISIIYSALKYAKETVDRWYKMNEDSRRMRVVMNHNNLGLDHYLKGDKPYLISFDRAKIDMPVFDLISLYKKHYLDIDFNDKLKDKLIVEAKEKLGVERPKEYLDILSKVNGIEFNGFILYGVDEYLLEHEINQSIYGLVDLNKIWYENEEQKKYLFLGESNISWYVYEYKNKIFIELDNPSGRESNKFNSFYEMFNKLLVDALM